PDLITDPMRHERSLRIIEHNAFFVIKPARTFIDLGDDRVQSEEQNLISQDAFGRVEHFTLPGKMIDEIGDVLRVLGPWRDDSRAVGLAAWNFTSWTLSEKIVQF